MLVPKNEWPFIRYIHKINECTMYRDMGLACIAAAQRDHWISGEAFGPDEPTAPTLLKWL